MKLSREYKIGLVTIIALALLLWGVNYLKGINVFEKSSKYYAVYSNVGGLIESAAIYVNGYKIGNVSRVEFNAESMDNIVVEFSIDSRIKLPMNTVAEIKSSSLISGVKDIYLNLGDGPEYYESGDTLLSLAETDMLAFLDPLIARVDELVISLNDILNEGNRENIGRTLENLQVTLSSLKQSLQPGGDLASTFTNLESVTGNLKDNNEKISTTLDNLASFTDSLAQSDLRVMIGRIDSTFAQLSLLVEGVNSGKGTAGRFVTNDSLYMNLNNSMASLDSLLTDLRENPGRYVRISVFGGRDK